ncbi:MAG: nucleotide exchange factor GrpE [Halobacteria archaeon]
MEGPAETEAKPASATPGEPDAERFRAEAARLKDENLYLRAELDNAGKRHAREKEEFRRNAAEGLIRALLEVRESLDRAAGSLREPAAAEGVRMILAQLDGVLAEQGLEPLPSVGQAFDPFFHEAVERIPSPEPEGRVVEEVRRGYRLHKKLLRPALVKVSAGPGGGRG